MLPGPRLHPPPVGWLQVIELELGDGATGKPELDGGQVLGVYLQVTQLSRPAKHLAGVAEEPAEVIQVVGEVQNDPSS